MRYRPTLEQLIIMYDCYIKTHSFRRVCRKFQVNFPNTEVPHRIIICRLVKKVHATDSVLDKKKWDKISCILIEEKLNEIDASFEQNHWNRLMLAYRLFEKQ